MDKEVLSFVVEKTHELMNAASCSKEAKASAQTWLDAVGTETVSYTHLTLPTTPYV